MSWGRALRGSGESKAIRSPPLPTSRKGPGGGAFGFLLPDRLMIFADVALRLDVVVHCCDAMRIVVVMIPPDPQHGGDKI